MRPSGPVISTLVLAALTGCAHRAPAPTFTERGDQPVDPSLARLVVTIYGIGDDSQGEVGGRINLGLFDASTEWLTAEDIPIVRVVLLGIDVMSIEIDDVPVGIWAPTTTGTTSSSAACSACPRNPGHVQQRHQLKGPATFEASFEVRRRRPGRDDCGTRDRRTSSHERFARIIAPSVEWIIRPEERLPAGLVAILVIGLLGVTVWIAAGD